MGIGLDPSIILASAKQYTGPDPYETARTLSQLSLHGVQKQQSEASLAGMLEKQNQEKTLREIYSQNAGSMGNLPSALMAGGFGQEAGEFSDRQSAEAARAAALQKLQQQGMREEIERHLRPLMGVKSDADIAAVKEMWRQEGYPEQNIAMLPDSYAQAAPKIKALLGSAMPMEMQADAAHRGATLDEARRHNQEMEKRPPAVAALGPGGGLSPDALDREAAAYNITHQMGAVGTGKEGAATRRRIINRAAELADGGDAGLAGNSADFKSNSASLKKLQTSADFMQSFEDTALKNLETALAAAAKVPDAGGTLLNKPIRAWAQMFGNTNMSAYKAALITARSEIGKVLSGSTGSAALSDSARHEVEDLMGNDASLAQLQSAAKILRTDMHNRKTAVAESIATIRGRMGGKKAKADGEAEPLGGTVTVRRKSDGVQKVLSPDAAKRVLADPAYEQVK